MRNTNETAKEAGMSMHETLVAVLKRTMFGDWVKIRNEQTGKIFTVFVPRG